MAPPATFSNRLAAIFELESNEARRITTMEGARGVAVALVFLVHYHAAFALWAPATTLTGSISQFLWTIGHSGVDLFFVLSGYLIYGAALKPSLHYGRFMKRRIHRIYPTFLVVLALYIALSFVFPSESKLPLQPFAAVVYVVQNLLMLPGLFPIEPIISVAWSLSYEFFFYLTLPVIVLLLRLQRWQPKARVTFWVSLSILFVASWFLLAPRASRMLMFLAGIVIYELLHSFGKRTSVSCTREWIAFALTCAAFASFPYLETMERGELYRTIVSALILGHLVYVLFRAAGPLRTTLSWTPLRWLGNMSYSYYLIHALATNASAMVLLKVVPESLQGTGMFWLLMLPVLIATLIASALLFALVEKPLSLTARRETPMPATAEAVAP